VDPHLKIRGIEVPLASRPTIRRKPVRRASNRSSPAPLRAVPEDTPWVAPSREEPTTVEVGGHKAPQLDTRGDTNPRTSAASVAANRSRRRYGPRPRTTDRDYEHQISGGRSIAGGSRQPRSVPTRPDTHTVEAAPVPPMEREATIIPPPTLANSKIAVPELSVPELFIPEIADPDIAAPDAAESVRFPVGGDYAQSTSANSTNEEGSRGTTPEPYVYGSLTPTPALNAAYPPLVPQHPMHPPPYSEAIESLISWLDDETLKGMQGTEDFSRRFIEKISASDLIDLSSPPSTQDARRRLPRPPAPGTPPSDPQRQAGDEKLSDHLRDLLTLVYPSDVKQRVSDTDTRGDPDDDSSPPSKTETLGDEDFWEFESPAPPSRRRFDESTTPSSFLSALETYTGNSDALLQPVQPRTPPNGEARPDSQVFNDDDLYD
jgi:hypothetical protein